MKIISTKEYNKLKKTQSEYLDLLMKPLQGVFEKVTDDDLLRENGLLNAENERLNNIINGMEKFFQYAYDNEVRAIDDRKVSVWTICLDKLKELKGVDKE